MEQENMTFELFINCIQKDIKKHYPHCRVKLGVVTKNNGHQLTAVNICEPECKISVTIYLESFYEAFQSEDCFYDEIFTKIVRIYEEKKVDNHFDAEFYTDFSNAKNSICFKLVNAEKNKEPLQNIPHRLFHDLAIVYMIRMYIKGEPASMDITNEHLQIWEKDEETLYQLAAKNTPRLSKGKIFPISERIEELIMDVSMNRPTEEIEGICDVRITEDSEFMYVASNAQGIQGAAVILYEGVLESFSKMIGSDFYIIAPTIHEAFLISVNAEVDPYELMAILDEINSTEEPEEVLSDRLYRYYQEKKSVVSI